MAYDEDPTLVLDSELEDITKEMLDYEPHSTTTAPDTGDTTSVNAAPGGWPRGGYQFGGQPASDRAQPFGRASRAISDALTDISAGSAGRQYPAIAAVLSRRPPGRSRDIWRTARPGDTRRQSASQGANESAFEPPRQRYIDIDMPVIRERVAVVEHRIGDIHETVLQMNREKVHLATVEQLQELDKRIDNAHLRIDRDVLPVLRKNFIKMALATIFLILSLVVNIITLYQYFKAIKFF